LNSPQDPGEGLTKFLTPINKTKKLRKEMKTMSAMSFRAQLLFEKRE